MWSSNGSPRRRVSVVRCAKRINNRTESLETATNLGGDCVAFGRRGHLYALLRICFFTPLAAVFALIAMAREQVVAGLVALGLSAIALNGIWNTSQKIDAARTMLEQSQRDVQRSQEDFERKMRELRSKLN